ncbi:cytochrome P450 [Infundibulicybe gibba]|nr:cytochrome P450 [Infundibulicybe gibba]
MFDSSTTAIATVAVAAYAFYRYVAPRGAGKLRLPPGPVGWPFFGNVFDLPWKQTWLTFARWGRVYGPISSISVFGQPIIFLNSLKPAMEMLGVKGKIYADRPELTMGGDMVGWKHSLPLMRGKESWQASRTMFHGSFGTHDKMEKGGYHAFEEGAMVSFLRAVMDMDTSGEEDGLDELIKTHVGAINLGMVYGYDVNPTKMHSLNSSIIRHIPSWFPGGAFRNQARQWAQDLTNLGTIPYTQSKELLAYMLSQMKSPKRERRDMDSGLHCWRRLCYRKYPHFTHSMATHPPQRLAFVRAFFLSMALHPEIQQRAQAEIDQVVGTNRLPGFADRQKLPYVNALCREISRFHSVVPSGMAHVAMEDDVHEGISYPRDPLSWLTSGALFVVLASQPMYANPETFDPSRFLDEGGRPAEKDVFDFIFGFGRRSCPGRVLAESSMYIMVAVTLSVFNISKALDATGNVIQPEVNQLSGSVRRVLFCSIPAFGTDRYALVQSAVTIQMYYQTAVT